EEYDSIKYTGQSAGLQLLDQELFKYKTFVRWPGRSDLVLQMMADDELMVMRTDNKATGQESLLDVGLSMRSAIFDTPSPSLEKSPLQKVSQSTADKMIALFFSHVHPFLPILHQPRFHARPSTIVTEAVLALSFRFASVHFAHLQDNAKEHANGYFRKVMHRLRDNHRSRLCHVQAALLMTLYLDLEEGDVESIQWCTLGSAIRMAQDLGMHRSCAHWNLPAIDIEIRHRVFYACYILDRWIGARAGKPLTILDRDFDTAVPSPYESPYPDSGGPIYQPFVLMIKLSEILGRILKALYAPNAKHSNRNAGLDDPTIRAVFERRLEMWKQSLEESVGGVYLTATQKVNLQVFYSTVVMLLHRPFISAEVLCDSYMMEESRRQCTEAATQLHHTVRQKEQQKQDPLSYGPLCLPTCFVYAMFQSSLVHFSNVRHDRHNEHKLSGLHSSLDLLRDHHSIGPASRAVDILTMLITTHELEKPQQVVVVKKSKKSSVYASTSVCIPPPPTTVKSSEPLKQPHELKQENEMPKSHWFQRMINTSIVGGITPDMQSEVVGSAPPLPFYRPEAIPYLPPYSTLSSTTTSAYTGYPPNSVYASHSVHSVHSPSAACSATVPYALTTAYNVSTAYSASLPTLPSSLNWTDWDLYLDQTVTHTLPVQKPL
ncbi:fungal-specific transcription factor domain-containing protein, partial [Spinellus fusiger]